MEADLAAMAEVAGMMQDWPSPRAARASRRAGNCIAAGTAGMRDVAPVTQDHTSRLTCITAMPPILSATIPSGTFASVACEEH